NAERRACRQQLGGNLEFHQQHQQRLEHSGREYGTPLCQCVAGKLPELYGKPIQAAYKYRDAEVSMVCAGPVENHSEFFSRLWNTIWLPYAVFPAERRRL